MKKVFLGVGHGGADSGAFHEGLYEKEINLGIALPCAAELRRHGVEVLLSRTKDEADPLTEEVRECNAFAPDLAVDIHTNSGGGKGFEVFYSVSGGTGKTLALNIEEQVKRIGQNSRGAKIRVNAQGTDYYGFIRLTRCPSVICECAFLDNTADRALINTQAGRDAFALAYAKGILQTLGIPYQSPGTELSPEVQQAVEIIRRKAGLEERTIQYLLDYRYGNELVRKLAAAME